MASEQPVKPPVPMVEQLLALPPADPAALPKRRTSFAMVEGDAPDLRDLALVLAVQTATLAQAPITPPQRASADAAASRLITIDAPLVQSLLMATKRTGADKAAALLAQVRPDMPTLDRALTLLWLQRALGGRPQANADTVALGAPWRRGTTPSGAVAWTLPAGTQAPANLALPAGQKAAWAFVSYQSNEAQAPALPVQVERTLWRVVAQPKPKPEPAAAAAPGQPAPPPPAPIADDGRLTVKLEAVKPGTPLDTNTLYLDQIELKAQKPLRWALVEAALPPGAAVEASTWGIDVVGADGKAQPLERALNQSSPQGYAVPVDTLAANGSMTLRHLVRFSQRGRFGLPPARVFRMYEPEAKAFADGRWAAVEVR